MEAFTRKGSWVVLAAALAFGGAEKAGACGLAFRVPTNRFDGCSETGIVSVWWRLADVQCGDLKIPLILHFTSRETPASALGANFELFPFDSTLIAQSDRELLMTQPDGFFNTFRKAQPTDTTIKGASGWLGELRGGGLTVIHTDCSYRLTYAGTRLTNITGPKNQSIDLIRSANNRPTELRAGGLTVLKVESDPATGEPKALAFGDRRIGIEWAARPFSSGRGLSKLTGLNGGSMEFTFGAENGQPNAKITAKGQEPRTLAWDLKTRLILSDSTPSLTWTYAIKPGANPRDNAAIERRNPATVEVASWWRDDSRGREEFQTVDGVKTIKTWFTSGILAGKPRKVEQVKDGETKTLVRYTYGEQGRLIREVKGDKTTLYKYDKDGNQVAATCNEQPIWERQYDQGKRLVKEVNFRTGTTLTRSYSSNGQWEDVTDEKGKVSSARYASDGKRLTEKLASGDQFSYEYDEQGRLKSRRYNQDLWEYRYDSSGRKVEVTVNGKPKEQYAYAPDGSWMEQKIYPKGGGTVETVFREKYDFSGRVIFEKMVCGGKRETTIKYRYDGSGRLVEKDSSAEGLIQYQYANGERIAVKVKKPGVKS